MEREKFDIRREAQAKDVPTPDINYVHEAMQAQRQQASAFTAHTEDLNRAHAAQMAGMQRETISEMERLANAQAEAAKRARIAEQALSGLRDVQMEDRDRLSKLAESQGVVHNHIDQSTVNNTQNVHQDTNVHNQVMHLVNTHGAQFGSFMEQQRMSQEAMMRLLHEHVSRTQPASVIYMMPPADSPMEVVQYTGGSGPPPPPPGAGSIKIKKTTKPRASRAIVLKTGGGDPPNPPQPPPPSPPAPEAVPVPTVPTAAAYFDIGSPPPRKRASRSRSAPRAQALRSISRVPWTTGLVPEDAMIPANPPQPPQPPQPPDAPPIRGRATKRAASTETVRYPSETAQPRPKAKAKARAKPKAKAKARAAPLPLVVLPTAEEAEITELITAKATRARLSQVQKKPKVMEAGKLAEEVGEMKPSRPVAKAKARPRPVPSAGSQGGKVPVIRRVRISTPAVAGVLKRGRGRPLGALGRAKREAAAA